MINRLMVEKPEKKKQHHHIRINGGGRGGGDIGAVLVWGGTLAIAGLVAAFAAKRGGGRRRDVRRSESDGAANKAAEPKEQIKPEDEKGEEGGGSLGLNNSLIQNQNQCCTSYGTSSNMDVTQTQTQIDSCDLDSTQISILEEKLKNTDNSERESLYISLNDLVPEEKPKPRDDGEREIPTGNAHQEIVPFEDSKPALHQEIVPFNDSKPALHEEIVPFINSKPALHQEIVPFIDLKPVLHQEIVSKPALHQEIVPFIDLKPAACQEIVPFNNSKSEIIAVPDYSGIVEVSALPMIENSSLANSKEDLPLVEKLIVCPRVRQVALEAESVLSPILEVEEEEEGDEFDGLVGDEGSEVTGESSSEFNDEAIWPAEIIEELSRELKEMKMDFERPQEEIEEEIITEEHELLDRINDENGDFFNDEGYESETILKEKMEKQEELVTLSDPTAVAVAVAHTIKSRSSGIWMWSSMLTMFLLVLLMLVRFDAMSSYLINQ